MENDQLNPDAAPEQQIRNCLKCGKPLTEIEQGYLCTKECGFKFYKVIAGKRLPPECIESLFTSGTTGLVDGFRKSTTDETFSACVVIAPPDYRPRYKFDDTRRHHCPLCKQLMTEFPKGIKCENSACGLSIWKSVSGKDIPDAQINRLLTSGETGKMDGFISAKNGKRFSAVLVVDRNLKKVVFRF